MVDLSFWRGWALRRPSLRGHKIGRCIQRGPGYRLFSAVERSTLHPRWVYLPDQRFSSIAHLFETFHTSEVPFQALRLRSGGLCCVSEEELNPNFGLGPSLSLGRQARRRSKTRTLSLSIAILLTCVLIWAAIPSMLGTTIDPENQQTPDGHSDASSSGLQPNASTDCRQLLLVADKRITDYLEDEVEPRHLKINVLENLQNGGLRSVRLSVDCATDQTISGLETHQEWRVTLHKSDGSWRVMKMAQLEN